MAPEVTAVPKDQFKKTEVTSGDDDENQESREESNRIRRTIVR